MIEYKVYKNKIYAINWFMWLFKFLRFIFN